MNIYQYCVTVLSLSLYFSPSLAVYLGKEQVCLLANFGCFMKSNYQITKVRTRSLPLGNCSSSNFQMSLDEFENPIGCSIDVRNKQSGREKCNKAFSFALYGFDYVWGK